MTEQQKKELKTDFFDGSAGEYRNQLHNEPEANPWIELALTEWIKGNNDSVHAAYGRCTPDFKQAIVQSLLETLEISANDTSQPVNAPFIEMALELIQATRDKSFVVKNAKVLQELHKIYPRLAPADQKTFMAVLGSGLINYGFTK